MTEVFVNVYLFFHYPNTSPRGATCLSADCSYSELLHPAKRGGPVQSGHN